MSSNWIRTALKYALLFTPTVVLLGLVAMLVLGAWVTTILHEPARFIGAPVVMQKFTRAAYWYTRKHWHTVPECVVYDSELLYRPRPGKCVFENAEFRTTMHFDDRGARITPDPAPGNDGSPRLVIVGDSHAMGWGVEDQETFASLLASEYGFRTLNFAVSSYGTARELKRLERDVVLEADDVIIVQYCDNDFEENRYFAAQGRVGPYDKSELDRLLAYEPTPVRPLPVAGLLLRLLADEFKERLSGGSEKITPGSISPTSAFLSVLKAYPQLRRHRIIVVAINGPGIETHLSARELENSGISLVVPELTPEDFLNIDDHMRARGHRTVAATIAARLTNLQSVHVP